MIYQIKALLIVIRTSLYFQFKSNFEQVIILQFSENKILKYVFNYSFFPCMWVNGVDNTQYNDVTTE